MVDNIVRPEILWIEGRCYRINDPSTEASVLQEHDMYENDFNYQDEDDDDDDDFEVTMIDNSRFTTSFHVSKHYFGYIIGKRGATRMRIEGETKTNIKIPKQGQTGDVTIHGSTASSVKAARRRINIIVMSSRLKQKPTHFLSIPMNTPEVIKNFETFKEQVLKTSGRGIEESIFVRTQRLHLTIGVMSLMDNEERTDASNILCAANETIVRPLLKDLKLKIRVKGVSYMNDDPSQVHVLFASVSEEGGGSVLQTLADQLLQHFYNAGFMKKEFGDHVKLHMTLMNSRYRGSTDEAYDPATRDSFDASHILETYADYNFGVVELNEMHLSQIGTTSDDQYYQPTCIISFR